MAKLILYTKPGCPNCKMIKTKLELKKIEFENIPIAEADPSIMEKASKKKISGLPILSVDGELYNLSEAVKYIKSL